jgi:transcriptional regulator with XRE-family HTH domain
MDIAKKSIGKRVARLRNDAGLTQLKLSEMINIHEKNLSSIERGINGLSMETLIALCEVFNISADYILFGEKERNTNTPLQNLVAKLEPDLQTYAEDFMELFVKMAERQ